MVEWGHEDLHRRRPMSKAYILVEVRGVDEAELTLNIKALRTVIHTEALTEPTVDCADVVVHKERYPVRWRQLHYVAGMLGIHD